MIDLPVNYKECSPVARKFVREEYVNRQKGLCSYCGKPLNGKASDDVTKRKVNKRLFPDNFFKYPVHLHHDHETGLTKGAVHCYCNAVLWQYYGE